jgi:hypothetical protein
MNDPRPEIQSAPRGWTTEIDDGTIDQAIAMLDEPEQLETDVTFYAPEFKSLLRTKTLGTKIARSLVKAAHRQQYQRVERDVAKSMLEFFRAQTREVTKKLFAQDWTPDPEHAAKQAKKLVAKAFDEDKWNEELVSAAGQPMADAFIEGAVAEIGLNNAAKRRKMQAAFNPDQPRDDSGRWADGGGTGGRQDTGDGSGTGGTSPSSKFGEGERDHEHFSSGSGLPRLLYRSSSVGDYEYSSGWKDRGVYVSTDPKQSAQYGELREFERVKPAYLLDLDGKDGTAEKFLADINNIDISEIEGDPDFHAELATEAMVQASSETIASLKASGYHGMRVGMDAFLIGKLSDYAKETERSKKERKKKSITKDADDFDDEYGDDIDFPTEMPAWLREEAQDFILEAFQEDYWLRINETTRLDIEGVLYRAIEDGMSIRDIAKEIQERTGSQYSRARATNVARTETTGAMSRGHISAMHEAYDGIDDIEPAKEWLSVLGTTTRDEHADADGQQVAVDADFTVGGEACSFPGDARLSAGNRCNCQCTIVSAFVGEGIYDDEGERGFDPNQARDEQGRWTGDGGGRGSRYEETDEEGDIISDWQGTGHASMRRADAEGKMTPRLKKFLDYMSKEPKFAGIAYRGVALPEKEVEEVFKVGRKVGVDGVQSFSTSKSVAARFASAPIGGRKVAVLIKAKVKDGRSNIRNNTSEREVIVRRENFKVKSVKESTSNWGEKMYVVELH